ncbi:MAG: ATP-binding protein [Bacteroidota bacterium]|nr:ATP-binding protein [Candidatus Kapabacteria bacterium]MDW8219528.1 ATP-binding protein [Bacteroidota bacterium]
MPETKSFIHARLTAFGDTRELERIRQFVQEKAREFGFSEQGAHTIMLAVDEACSNLICHSYHFDKAREFFIDIRPQGTEALVIEIFDNGAAFDPFSIPPPNLQEYALQHRKGGFGVHIIRTIMDTVEYFPATHTHQMNCLKLVKKLS